MSKIEKSRNAKQVYDIKNEKVDIFTAPLHTGKYLNPSMSDILKQFKTNLRA
jgi:hypothetical protein